MSKHYKRHTKKNKFKKGHWGFRVYFGLFCIVASLLFWIVIIARYHIGNVLLVNYGKTTKGIVTDQKDTNGRFHKPCYMYEFFFEGEYYYGNSLIENSEKDRIGDSIDVVYLDFWPSMNRPTYFFK